jgi:hypothetical protein
MKTIIKEGAYYATIEKTEAGYLAHNFIMSSCYGLDIKAKIFKTKQGASNYAKRHILGKFLANQSRVAL